MDGTLKGGLTAVLAAIAAGVAFLLKGGKGLHVLRALFQNGGSLTGVLTVVVVVALAGLAIWAIAVLSKKAYETARPTVEARPRQVPSHGHSTACAEPKSTTDPDTSLQSPDLGVTEPVVNDDRDAEYWLHFHGQATGPFSTEAILEGLRFGDFTPDMQVCRDGQRQWAAISEHEVFNDAGQPSAS